MPRFSFSLAAVLLSSLVCALWAPVGARTGAPAVAPLPETLRETGLYADWDTRTVAADNLPFSPQYPLWTDGAGKARWLHLPAGSWIDAADPDAWVFPVGTKVWKEFRFHGQPAETRLIERTVEGWRYASYAWRPDGTARLVAAPGILNSIEIRAGVRHAIPSRSDCAACHEAGPSRLLGVSALQLSDDRDPLAPHAEPMPAGGVGLGGLVARGLVRNLPATLVQVPPRIEAPTPVTRAALGYLHGNCGMCHTGAGELASLQFVLHHAVSRPHGGVPAALTTTVAQPSHFRTTALPDIRARITPGQPNASMLLARMDSRHPVLQMPPLGSRLVDTDAVALLRRWIAEDTTLPLQTRATAR